MFVRRVAILLAVGWLGACATPGGGGGSVPGKRDDPRIALLSQAIGTLGGSGGPVGPGEARRAAASLVARSDQLRLDYRMVRPAQLHNLLVNVGLRERGLCCHFAEDLIAGLLELELRTLEVHWVVARHGSRLREHSSVLLVPIGGGFEDGLVVDAWRRAGELVWARVVDDRYPWQLHPMNGNWERLHCRETAAEG